MKGITGVEAAQKAANASKNLLGGFKDTYNSRLEQEKSGVSKPGIAGMVETPDMSPSAYGTGTTKSAESITTGGTRNTSINMTITKLIESFNVSWRRRKIRMNYRTG